MERQHKNCRDSNPKGVESSDSDSISDSNDSTIESDSSDIEWLPKKPKNKHLLLESSGPYNVPFVVYFDIILIPFLLQLNYVDDEKGSSSSEPPSQTFPPVVDSHALTGN